MKQFFFFVLMFAFASNSWACSAAYQYSLFPLGKSMGRLVILEVELDRYLLTPDNQMMYMGGNNRFNQPKTIETRWKGSLKLFTVEAGKMVLFQEIGTIDLLDNDYQEALLPLFQKAYTEARAMPLFEEAVLEKVGFCHHDRSCELMKLTIDEDSVKLYASSTEEGYQDKKCAVPFSEKALMKVEHTTKIPFSDFENVEKEYQIDFFRLWSPVTVRRYRIGTQTVQVFSLGRGDKSRYTLTKEEVWTVPNIESIAHYIEGNDVLFHGQRFDFFYSWD